MASLRVPLVCLFAVATHILAVADEPAPPATAGSAVPLAGSGDIIALAGSYRERWQQPKGNWEFKPDSLTGSGDSRIDFRGPFKPPFTLEFRVQVLKGMRPRVHLGPLTFANEGYERTFALHPGNGDGVPFSYEENRPYQVSLVIEPDGALLTVDGRKIMTATLPIEEVREIGFSGGDWWSKGATRFSEILIRPRAIAAPVAAPIAPTALPKGSPPLQEEFERDAAAIAEERKGVSNQLAKEYAGQLEALASQLSEEGRTILAAAARTEKARVEAGLTITEESASRAPFEVLSARAVYLEKLGKLTHDYDAKTAQRAARYLAALEKSASSSEGEDAAATRAFVEKERARLSQAGQPLARRITQRTPPAGGEGGGPFEEVAEDDALLTGLVLHTGDFAGHRVLVAVQPIFRSARATRNGTPHGVPRGAAVKLEAEEGYAVGGLNLHTGDRVDGLEIVFMKIKPGRLALDPADAYKSQWVGGKGGGPAQIGGSGNAVVGLFGASGSEFDSIGLIELQQSAAPAPKPRPATVKEVTRENPATLAVTSLTAQPLVESPAIEAGKWQRVPEPLRGAKIFCVTPNKHLGAAEYKITAPGRVYLACNYDYQGNRAGSWSEERWMPEDFLENGWTRVEGLELRSWDARTFIVFTKELKAGETGRLRCNKYEPPYFITFTP